MADDRKIILQLELDATKSISNLITVKDRIAKLKEEQKQLNTTTSEGKATYEAYNGQIKALTKEQKSLENAVSQTASAMEFEAGSIAANRAELSKLTAEYKNIAKPTAEQTQKIKALSDTLKAQESAIGNNTRSVGGYKDALEGAAQGIGVFSPQLGGLTNSFNGVTNGVKTASKGFSTLKGAIATTGIGLLLLAFASLISYFKSTDDGGTKLAATMSAFNSIIKQAVGYLAQVGDVIFGLVDGTKSFEEVLSGLGDAILENLINRVKSVLVLGSALGKFFEGEYSQAFKLGLDATIQFTTGVTNATDKASAFATEMARLSKEAYDYEVALDSINDRQRDLNVTNAKANQIVQQLIIQAKNKTLSDEEEIAIRIKANKIAEESFKRQLNLDKERAALIKSRNEREAGYINLKLQNDLKEAKSEEEKQKLLRKGLQINDDLNQEYSDLQKKIIDDETAYLILVEGNNNKLDLARQQQAEKREKQLEKEREAQQKSIEQLEAIMKAEEVLEISRLNNKKRLLDIELNDSKTTSDRRIEILKEQFILELEIERQSRMMKLDNSTLLESERLAIVEDGLVKEAELKAKFLADETKIEDEKKKKEAEDEKKRFESLKKEANQWLGVINAAIALASQAVALKLDKDLTALEDRRQQDLKRFGKTQADKDRINAKYDKEEKKRRKQAAQEEADIKTVSAIINTAVGVTQALAQGGIAGIALGAVVAAAGALEILAIQNNAAKLEKGGLIPIGGNLHSSGGTTFRGTDGTVFEAERGEVLAVVNRHDAPMLSHLSAINSVHGKPFFGGNRPSMKGHVFADGGIVARTNSAAVQESISQQNATAEAIRNMPSPVVLVKDINTGQGRNVLVKDRANF